MTRTLYIAIAVVIVVIVAAVAIYYSQTAGQKPSPPLTTQPPPTTTTSTASTTQTTSTAVQQCPQLVILTRHPTAILNVTRTLFLNSDVAKRYGIKDLVFKNPPASQWETLIKQGGIDVAWGGGPTLFNVLYQDGLLLPLQGDEVKAALSQVPDAVAGMPLKLKGPDGNVYWVAWAISSFGITVNFDFLNKTGLPTPRDWSDLASFTFGKALLQGYPATSIGDISRSTSSTRMAEIILQAYGWDRGWRIITLTAANGKVWSSSEDARDAVIRGDSGAGWTIDFYGYIAQLQNPHTKYIIPLNTTVNGDPIAVVVGTKCRQAAEAFVAWVITDGQRMVFDKSINRLPSNPNAFNTPEGQSRPDLKAVYQQLQGIRAMNFNDSLAMSYEQAIIYYFVATIVQEQGDLQNAWKAILQAYYSGKINATTAQRLAAELGSPIQFTVNGTTYTFTQQYAQSINSRIAKDAAFRDQMIAIWRDAARKKYLAIIDEVKSLTS
ncbi:MAG: ABC transporter substrate-binding protein [Thermoproteus sp.]